MKKADLTKAAKELNELFVPDPPINEKAGSEALKTELGEALLLYAAGDKISSHTIGVWRELDWESILSNVDNVEKDEDDNLTDRERMETNLHDLGIWVNSEEEEAEVAETEAEEVVEEPPAPPKEEPKKEDPKPKKKPTTEKKEPTKAVKPKKVTHASVMDSVLANGGVWDKLVKKAQDALQEAGIEKTVTKATLMAHVHYRERQGKSLNLAITDKGLEKE